MPKRKEELIETDTKCPRCKGKVVQVKGLHTFGEVFRCPSCGFQWQEGSGAGPGVP